MLKQIRKLCKPAYVYLVLSAITIILMMVQNAGASGTYKVGMYQCPCNNTAGIFLGKAIYVAFWTFILNAVCKAGYKSVSWFLVLFPMILGAVLVGLVLMSGGIREGINEESEPEGINEESKSEGFFYSFIQRIFNFLSGNGFVTNRQKQRQRKSDTDPDPRSSFDSDSSVEEVPPTRMPDNLKPRPYTFKISSSGQRWGDPLLTHKSGGLRSTIQQDKERARQAGLTRNEQRTPTDVHPTDDLHREG